MTSVHFASDRMTWATPDSFFAALDAVHRFDLDAAADADNAKCPEFFSKDGNCGLASSWAGRRVFCNPPYGREIGHWIDKAIAEAAQAQLIVMLVPARTDTAWWHRAIRTARVQFLRGRLRFKGAPSCAPFPSALLYWNAFEVTLGGIK